jgi:TolB-like protein
VVRTSAAEYLLEGTLAVRPHRPDGKRPLEIVVRLHEIDSGKHLWSRSCTETVDSRDPVAIAEIVAARLAATILAAKG